MINVETLAYQLELKTKKVEGVQLELHRNQAGFDLALLMGYHQEFRTTEVVGVLLKNTDETPYSVQYYGSIISSHETFLSPYLDKLRKKSPIISFFGEMVDSFPRIDNVETGTFKTSLHASNIKFPDAENFMEQMLKIFKLKSQYISLVPDMEFVSFN